MDISNLISRSVQHSAIEAFATMLNVELKPGDIPSETALPEPSEGVVSFIGLAGAWVGTGSILCSPSLACRICSQMLLTEVSSVDEEVLDAVGELTNIVIGSVKNDLERHLGPLGLSIPTVLFGRNFKTRTANPAQWVVERFHWEADEIVVKVCLAPAEKHPGPHTFGHTSPMELSL